MIENGLLRRVFGPKGEELTGGWSSLHSVKMHSFITYCGWCDQGWWAGRHVWLNRGGWRDEMYAEFNLKIWKDRSTWETTVYVGGWYYVTSFAWFTNWHYFDVLLTVHLSIIVEINQLNAQNLVV